jgi:hypothetical protein
LREDDHRDLGVLGADFARGTDALVRVIGGMRMSAMTTGLVAAAAERPRSELIAGALMRAPTLLGAMTLLLHDPVARWLVVAAAVATVVGEIVATLIGQGRDGQRGLLGNLADALVLDTRGRRAALRQDRGTRPIGSVVSAPGGYWE